MFGIPAALPECAQAGHGGRVFQVKTGPGAVRSKRMPYGCCAGTYPQVGDPIPAKSELLVTFGFGSRIALSNLSSVLRKPEEAPWTLLKFSGLASH